MNRLWPVVGLLAACLSWTGCQPERVCPDLSLAAPVQTVVGDYNTNARKVPRLWTYAKVAITFRESPGDLGLTWGSTSPLAEVNARLIFAKTDEPDRPADFFLLFKEAGQEIGRLGVSNADNAYYFWMQAGDHRQCLWGNLDLAGAPGIKDLPLDPTQLLSVLAICELPADFTAPPVVLQSYCSDPCAYVLTYVDRQPITNRILARREMYFDRSALREDGVLVEQPRRPFRVRILDEQGRPILDATMKDYRPIAWEDVTLMDAPPPIMPTDIKLRWLETGTELHMILSGMTTADKVDPAAFLFWDRLPGGLRSRCRQVDGHLRLAPPAPEGSDS
jgi:hypothetical protein